MGNERPDDMTFAETHSARDPDWSREKPRSWWDPSRQLLRSIRKYQSTRGALAPLVRRYWVLQHRFWSVVTGAEIPIDARIGGGLLLPHPNGVVVHPKSEIGCNCLLFQQVTIAGGARIGGHVDVGAGAKVLGPSVVGNHVQIGANAVVKDDLPDGAVAVGIPARIISMEPLPQD
jgi:serine O-acetyltransferase